MKSNIIKLTLGTLVIGLTGFLVACGGSDSPVSGAGETKLLASDYLCNPTWNSATAYNGGAKVGYSGQNYTAAYWSQGVNPSTNNGPAGSGKPWNPGTGCIMVSTTTTKPNTTTTTKVTVTSTTMHTACFWPCDTTTKGVTTTTAPTSSSTTTTKAVTTTTVPKACFWPCDTTTKGVTTTTAPTSSSTTTKATTTTTLIACPPYVAGTVYAAGKTVANAGGNYTCTVSGWCSLGVAAYEPGVGWAWTNAWAVAAANVCGPKIAG